ncbi:MAG: hypothetical protein AB7S81_06720 [Bdellovibrionales bacterium]
MLQHLAREMGYENKLMGGCRDGKCSVSIKKSHAFSKDMFRFAFSVMGHGCCLWGLKFDKHKKGHGYGGMAMKSLFGVCHEYGVKQISIHGIMDDGWSFWPYFGGIDKKACEGTHLKDAIIHVAAFELSAPCHEEERGAVRGIAEMAEHDPEKAWHALAQSKIIMPLSKAGIFKRASRSMCMLVDLMDKETQNTLRKRLGVLPPFPREDLSRFQPSQQFLAKSLPFKTAMPR